MAVGYSVLKAVRRDPLGFAQRLHAQCGDVAVLKVLSTRIYYLFRPEAVRQVLVDHYDDFVKDERARDIMQSVHGANVITTEGQVWGRQRRILTPAFAPKRIAACAQLMAATADECICQTLPDGADASKLIDVDDLTTRITIDVILRAPGVAAQCLHAIRHRPALLSWTAIRHGRNGIDRGEVDLPLQLLVR